MPHDPAADLPLAAEFATATRADWEKLALGVLKGRPLDALTTKTHGGLSVEPLYERAAGTTPLAGRGAAAPWQILQRIDNPDPAAANAQALEDLENGATGLALVFRGALGAYGFGLEPTRDAVGRALRDVYLDAAPVECDASSLAPDEVETATDALRATGVSPDRMTVRFGIDPFGAAARAGQNLDWPAEATRLATLIETLRRRGFRGPFAAADARVVHTAGGSETQELGFALAAALACWRALEKAGVDETAARDAIFFRLAADADQFLTIGKLRAIRKLWARVEASCGVAPRPAFVSVETAWRMMTRRDPHVNLLRCTMAAFSAAVAGANAITVLPYTAALGLPDATARRLARNTQAILLEESNLAKVGDPGAGSGAIEDLTGKLCGAAWDFFQAIERSGGLAAALNARVVQEAVGKVRAARAKTIAMRRDALTGASEFPNLAETPPSVLAPLRPAHAAQDGSLAPIRLSEPFEALRDASDTLRERTGRRPRVFLATLGAPADYLARATFARSLFEAGGIEAVEPAAADTPLGMLRDFRRSGAALVCLCGTDAAYATEGADAAAAFQQLGAKAVYVAGRPSEVLARLQETGAAFVFMGGDAVATLEAAHAKLASRQGRR